MSAQENMAINNSSAAFVFYNLRRPQTRTVAFLHQLKLLFVINYHFNFVADVVRITMSGGGGSGWQRGRGGQICTSQRLGWRRLSQYRQVIAIVISTNRIDHILEIYLALVSEPIDCASGKIDNVWKD